MCTTDVYIISDKAGQNPRHERKKRQLGLLDPKTIENQYKRSRKRKRNS